MSTNTPIIEQYKSIKKDYPDHLLFFRLGDFYELFFDDAIKASEELGIFLTYKSKDKSVPMCGVPFHASEIYLQRLIKKGYRVAICEQVEKPEEKISKKPLRRKVVRIVTPGTLTEDHLLEGSEYNFLLVISANKSKNNEIGIAYADISTGDFFTESVSYQNVNEAILRLEPKEILISEKITNSDLYKSIEKKNEKRIRTFPDNYFDFQESQKKLQDYYKIKDLIALGNFTENEICAASVLVQYVSITQISDIKILHNPQSLKKSNFLRMDDFTLKSLEIFQNMQGKKDNTLLNHLDLTETAEGSRLIRKRIMYPLLDINEINKRLDSVEFFLKNPNFAIDIKKELKKIPDMRRIITRLELNRWTINDLILTKKFFTIASRIKSLTQKENLSQEIKTTILTIQDFTSLYKLIENSIDENSEHFIKLDTSNDLKVLCNKRKNIEEEIIQLEQHYAFRYGIKKLKIRRNSIIGFFIEIGQSNKNKMPYEFFIKQSLTKCIRYSNAKITKIENEIENIELQLKRIKDQILNKVVHEVLLQKNEIVKCINALGILDISNTFASIAKKNSCVRPSISNSKELKIEIGKHPIVNEKKKDFFIGNDCDLNKNKIWLITGPNMSGKSTFLRQNALIILMAQIGAFVPAKKATIGIVDKLFSRVGANDDISNDKSTFMNEMIETAVILNNASEKSFAIIDEIGRGTEYKEGFSLALCILEYIVKIIQCRCLFATHFQEIPKVFITEGIENYQIKDNENSQFAHQIIPGVCENSLSTKVAQKAGIPKIVIDKAVQISQKIKENRIKGKDHVKVLIPFT